MRLSLQQKEQFFHEMGELLRSGRTLTQSLESIARSRNPRIQQAAGALLNAPAVTPAEAFRAVPVFSGVAVELVAGGEAAGRLEDAMDFLAAYYGRLARLQSQLIGALLYPIFLLHFGAFILAVPALIVSGVGAFAGQVLLFLGVIYACALGMWLLVRGLANAAERSVGIDSTLLRLPLVGAVREAWAANRFSLVLSMLVKSSGSILAAITRAAKATGSARMIAGSAALIAAVQRGESLGGAVVATRAFPEIVERAFEIGETTGRLDEEMARAAASSGARYEQRLQLLSGIASKGILVVVVLALAARMLESIFSYAATLNSLLE